VIALDSHAPRITSAFSTLGCAELELVEALELAANHGIDAIEIRALGSTIDLVAYFTDRFGSPASLAKVLEGSAVGVCAFNTSLRLVGATAQAKEEFLRHFLGRRPPAFVRSGFSMVVKPPMRASWLRRWPRCNGGVRSPCAKAFLPIWSSKPMIS